MNAPYQRWLTLAVALIPLTQAFAAEPYQDLLKRAPEQTNALLLVDFQALLRSPLAVREKWADDHKKNKLGGVSSIPPDVQQLVTAAQINPSSLEPAWKIAMAQMSNNTSIAQLVQGEAGKTDSVAGQSVVLSPRNAYYVSFAPKVVGAMKPANRQELGRWLRFAKSNSRVVLSQYLQVAAVKADATTPVVMAIDLTDVLDLEGLRKRLTESKSLAGKGVNIEQLAKVFTGMKGVKFSAKVGNTIEGELRLDFSEPVDMYAKVAKPLVLETMDGMGAAIDDVDDWKVLTLNNAFVLSGNMTKSGLRQIISPMLAPNTVPQIQASASPGQSGQPGPTGQDPKAAATLRYFHSVKTLIDDLNKQKAKTFKQLAYWYQQCGKNIDELPILNVDDEMLKYGMLVSTSLRGMATLASGTSAQNKVLEKSATQVWATVPVSTGYGYGYGNGWGYGGTFNQTQSFDNFSQINASGASNTAKEAAIRNQTWQQIETATVQIRKKMVDTYKIEF